MTTPQPPASPGTPAPGPPPTSSPALPEPTAPTSAAPERFESLNPTTGEVLGSWPVSSVAEVRAAVARGEVAAVGWKEVGFDGRRRALDAWRHEIARRSDELAGLVHRENGKPVPDAILEILVALDHLAWAGANARSELRSRKVWPGILALNHAAEVHYEPLGVVGVIGPWNYPVLTPMGSLAYALAAGNAVVYKPSEYTPGIGAWLVEAWVSAVPNHSDVLQLVTGAAATGAALCRSGIAKMAFTGSESTGRRVMAECAENLVPVLLECGGKDAAIVTEEADLDAAAENLLWGGLSNAGQTCLGIERIYVVGSAYQPFLDRLRARASKLSAGREYGPITMPAQVGVIRRHVAEALGRGGKALTGGEVTDALVPPTILTDVPETAAAVQEETFGPTLTVTAVDDVAEALRRVNGTVYGLGGAVFADSGRRGAELARGFRSGMVSVNGVMTFASVPGLPMGGVGASGFGRTHGPEGLREFSRTQAVTRLRFPLPLALTSFDRTPTTDRLLRLTLRLRHARR